MRRGSTHKTVNLSKLAKQLRREATSNPKKAAALGLLALVALWFWAPLVKGWFVKDNPAVEAKPAKPAGDSSPTSVANVPSQSGTEPKKAEKPQRPWYQLVQWMEEDPRTSATDPFARQRDPFSRVKTRVVIEKPEELSQSLGMELSSTIIGSNRRVARINGKTYQEGSLVEIDKNGREIEFRLERVERRRVVLNRDGKQFELKLAGSPDSGRIKVVRNTP